MNKDNKPVVPSLAVDGSYLPLVGVLQFRVVNAEDGAIIRASDPIRGGTNNIAEFLAVTTAMLHCHRNGINVPIYSDSTTAIAWVKRGKTNTSCKIENQKLQDMIDGAERFLKEHGARFTVLKWETKNWGENPADYGRK